MAKLSVRKWLLVLLLPAALCLLPACGESDRDETEPFISLTTKLEDVTPRQLATVDLVGTIDEDATLEVRLNNVLVGGFTVSGGGWSGTIAGLREGNNEIALTAVDEAGNTNTIRISVVLDTTGPVVTSPRDGAVNLPHTALTIVFNEALDELTVSPSNFTVTGPGPAPVAGTLGYTAGELTVVFTPDIAFSAGTTYAVDLGTGITDVLGNAAATQRFIFTTAP